METARVMNMAPAMPHRSRRRLPVVSLVRRRPLDRGAIMKTSNSPTQMRV